MIKPASISSLELGLAGISVGVAVGGRAVGSSNVAVAAGVLVKAIVMVGLAAEVSSFPAQPETNTESSSKIAIKWRREVRLICDLVILHP
jgi:hypothetical protein